MNRVGDMMLSIAFFALFWLFGNVDYATVFSIAPFMNETAITIIGILLLFAAMGKSAQIGLHSWLPGSMEGFLFTIFVSYLLWLFYVQGVAVLDLYFTPSFNLSAPIIFLPKLHEALIGDLLGDGHLRFTHKDKLGKYTGNAHYAMTLKNFDYAYFLWKDIYSSICTNTPLRPWPKPTTGIIPSQYAFSTRSLPELTELHKQWYKWSINNNKFIKIVPKNIADLLTAKGLAHWLMGDGYWSKGTIYICTDNFSSKEVDLLIKILLKKFTLKAGKIRRIKANKEICWRIRFSGKTENISKLVSLVRPHFIPSMLYKLNI